MTKKFSSDEVAATAAVTDPRAALKDVRRVVLKVGSRAVVGSDGKGRFTQFAAEIATQRALGREVVLVSSGAVAMGMQRLGLAQRPKDMAKLQAAAAAGQSALMRAYEDALSAYSAHTGQVLLTHADLADRDRYLNARASIDALLEFRAVPIINENDAVAVEEIRFGDNDQLAAMVATLVGADLLVLLTNVDGILDAENTRIPLVRDTDDVEQWVRTDTSDVGLGGMGSKIDAARRATRRGVPALIGDARDPALLRRALDGEEVGTLFLPKGSRLASRKHWIAYTLKPQGAILVDQGAAEALSRRQTSLLPAGVLGVRGRFSAGDPVAIVAPDGREIARGLVRYEVVDVARLAGAKSSEIEARIGRFGEHEVVHRDDLVLLER